MMMKKFFTAAIFALVSVTASQFLTSQTAIADPVKIAIVDTGNTGRSVTAEALANAIIKDKKLDVVVISRGVDVDPFDTAPEANFVTLLAKRSLDVTSHRAVQLTQNDIAHAKIILTMTAKHRDNILAKFPDAQGKIFTLSDYAKGEAADVADAYGKPMEFYEKTFTQIDSLMLPAMEKAGVKAP